MQEAKCPFCGKVNPLPSDVKPDDRDNWECIWCGKRFGELATAPTEQITAITPQPAPPPPAPTPPTAPMLDAETAARRARVHAQIEEFTRHKRAVQRRFAIFALVLLLAGLIYYLQRRVQWQIDARIRRLATADETVHNRTVASLVEYGDRAVPSLIAATDNADSNIRRGAVKALGIIRSPEALDALLTCLRNDDNSAVRAAAAANLGAFRSRDALMPLTLALKDSSWSVRSAAARALGKLGDPSAVPQLIEILTGGGENMSVVKVAAAEALGNIGGSEAAETLKQVMTFDPDETVANAARDAYAKLTGTATEPEAEE